MNDEMFNELLESVDNELLESVEQADEMIKGNSKPSREFHFDDPKYALKSLFN